MKNALLKLISGVFILAFTGCTSVQFYSNPELTQKSGLKYYTVKPFLQVERETVNNKEDFMWHAVPSMKSHVALHPGT
jgi:hypothetical protein